MGDHGDPGNTGNPGNPGDPGDPGRSWKIIGNHGESGRSWEQGMARSQGNPRKSQEKGTLREPEKSWEIPGRGACPASQEIPGKWAFPGKLPKAEGIPKSLFPFPRSLLLPALQAPQESPPELLPAVPQTLQVSPKKHLENSMENPRIDGNRVMAEGKR